MNLEAVRIDQRNAGFYHVTPGDITTALAVAGASEIVALITTKVEGKKATSRVDGKITESIRDVLNLLCKQCSTRPEVITEHLFVVPSESLETFKKQYQASRLGRFTTQCDEEAGALHAYLTYP